MNTTQIDQRDLVKTVRTFRDCDDKLKELNKQVQKLREEKKLAEEEMAQILQRKPFSELENLDLKDSIVKIQRPETWSKPWSLSKRDLETIINAYFHGVGSRAEGPACFEYIVETRKRDLISKEFSFTRVVNVADKDGDAADD